MRELDLEVAGEFILMAATLIRIKVQMLLPRDPSAEEEEEDPRDELVNQLLEYRRYKEVSETMSDLEERQRRLFPHLDFSWSKSYTQDDLEDGDEPSAGDVSLFDLLTVFKTVLENMPKIDSHHVDTIGVTIEDQINYLVGRLSDQERLAFTDLMLELRDRVTVIMTFMAMLELLRTRRIIVQQATLFGEIWILGR